MISGLHFYGHTLRQEDLKHGGIGPLQFPAVLDRQQTVSPRKDVAKVKGSIGIALVAAEEDLVVLGVFWGQQDHYRAGRFAVAQGGTLDLAVSGAGHDLQLRRITYLHSEHSSRERSAGGFQAGDMHVVN